MIVNSFFLPCLKYIERSHSFDNLTFGSASFDICSAFGNYDITTFRQHAALLELSMPQHISRFWRKICSLNQLSSFFLFFSGWKCLFIKKYKPSEFITIWKGQRWNWRKSLRTHHTMRAFPVVYVDSIKKKNSLHLACKPFFLIFRFMETQKFTQKNKDCVSLLK